MRFACATQRYAPRVWRDRAGFFDRETFRLIPVAQEARGVLMIDDDAAYELYKARWFFKKFLMNRGSLHMLDIALFYKNLERNVGERIAAYLSRPSE